MVNTRQIAALTSAAMRALAAALMALTALPLTATAVAVAIYSVINDGELLYHERE